MFHFLGGDWAGAEYSVAQTEQKHAVIRVCYSINFFDFAWFRHSQILFCGSSLAQSAVLSQNLTATIAKFSRFGYFMSFKS